MLDAVLGNGDGGDLKKSSGHVTKACTDGVPWNCRSENVERLMISQSRPVRKVASTANLNDPAARIHHVAWEVTPVQ